MPFCSKWTPFHARNFHLCSPICLNIANFPSVTQHFPRQCHKYMKHGMLTSFSVDQQYKTSFNQTAGKILIIRLISSTIVQKTNECIKYYTYVISWRFFFHFWRWNFYCKNKLHKQLFHFEKYFENASTLLSTRPNWILYVLKYSRIKIFSGAHVTI